MKTKALLIGLLLVVISFLSCNKDDDPPIEPLPSQSKLENIQFTSQALANSPIGNSTLRDMVVYTPKGYEADGVQEYPVVYLLHGLPFSERSYIDESTWDQWIDPAGMFKDYPDFPAEEFKDWIDNLIESKKIEPLIIVMPNAGNEMYGFSFYSNSFLNGNFEDFIAFDLVNFIDANYRTIADSNGRAVIGNSQGGYAAFMLGMKHSDIFSVVASHSGLIVADVVLASGPVVVAENPGGFAGPDPAKFLTSAGYALSAAWSPNLNNPPFFVDLPFEYPSGDVIPSVRARWLEHDAFSILDTYAANFGSLKGIYFDCGDFDELSICDGNGFMMQKLDAYGIDYVYKTFAGGHFDKMFSRLEVSLEFCSEKMN